MTPALRWTDQRDDKASGINPAGLAARREANDWGERRLKVTDLRCVDTAANCSNTVLVAAAAFCKLGDHDHKVAFVAIVG